MGVVGTIAAIPRLAKQNGKVNFPTLATYASCTRKFESQIRGHSADFLLPRLLYAGHCPKATDWNFNVPIPGEQKVRIFCRSSKLFLEYGT